MVIFSTNTTCESTHYRSLRSEEYSARGVRKRSYRLCFFWILRCRLFLSLRLFVRRFPQTFSACDAQNRPRNGGVSVVITLCGTKRQRSRTKSPHDPSHCWQTFPENVPREWNALVKCPLRIFFLMTITSFQQFFAGCLATSWQDDLPFLGRGIRLK